MIITTSQILQILENSKSEKNDKIKRLKAYDGKNSFLNTFSLSSGKMKSDVPIPLIKFAVDTHTQGILANPLKYESQKSDLKVLKDIITDNHLDTQDSEHFRMSLIEGSSVEVHSFEEGRIKITQYPSHEWTIILDEKDNIIVALHECELKKYTVFQEKLLDKDLKIITVYTDTDIKVFTKNEQNGLTTISETTHFYGEVPIVIFATDEYKLPYITDNIININSIYSRLANLNIDEVEQQVDSILKFTGFGTKANNLQEIVTQIKEHGAVLLPGNSDLTYVQKSVTNTDKFNDVINRTRQDLFALLAMPDISTIFGYNNTSSMTLLIKFQPTIKMAKYFFRYFKFALLKRISLINKILEFQNLPLLPDDIKIKYNYDMPIDITQVAKAMRDLEGIVSRKTQLELLPNIDIEEELKNTPEKPLEENQTERIKKREEVINSVSSNVTETLPDLLNNSIDENQISEFLQGRI